MTELDTLRAKLAESEAREAELQAALEPFRDCEVKVGMNGLVPIYRTVGRVLDSAPAGKGLLDAVREAKPAIGYLATLLHRDHFGPSFRECEAASCRKATATLDLLGKAGV